MLTRLFKAAAAGYLAAILGIAIVTATHAPFRAKIHDATIALTLVLVVLLIASLWGRGPGIFAAVLGMFSYNFFLSPPANGIFSFTVTEPHNWIALAAFLVTASVAGHLSVAAKRRAVEAEAGRKEARLASAYNRSLIEASLDPLVTIGPDGKITDVNVAAETVTGRLRSELIGTDFSSYFTEPDRAKAGYRQVFREGFVRDYALDLRHRDGRTTPVRYNASVYRDENGVARGVFAAARDITELKRAENEIKTLARLQSVVAELGQRALVSDRYESVLDEAVIIVAQTLQIDYCNALEMLPGGEELLLRAAVGWKEGYVGQITVSAQASEAGYTVRSQRALIVADASTETRFVLLPQLLGENAVSAVSVVISTSAGSYGTLSVHSRQRRLFTEDEVNFLQTVANVLGSAIERHRGEASLRRINRAHRALSSCNQAVIRAANETSLFQQICDIVVEQAGYRLCWVGRAEHDEAKSVLPIAQAGFEEGYLKTLNITWADAERGRGPTGTCIRTGKTTLAKDIATDPNMAPWRAEALKRGYASSIAIPLCVDAGVFGALMIYAAEPEAFSAEEVKLLTELAEDLAFGITALRTMIDRARAEDALRALNAELEQRVSSRTAELQAANALKDQLIVRERAASAALARAREHEIEIGFRIQQTLLLDEPPRDVPGMRLAALTVPSQRIDGDFYVFFRHPDQRLDVIVGDVMGKGVPAALLGAATKSHFIEALSHLTALSKNGNLPEPKEVVTLVHAEVARHLIGLENFVTLCYTRLDLNQRRFDLVDCGHTGILHLHGETGLCEIVHGDNLPLGIREGEIYNQISVPFQFGDLLLFYSDGVTEARNAAGELFTADRLLDCVRANKGLDPQALVEAIREATVRFSTPGRLSDDLTCVAVKIEEPELLLAHAKMEIRSELKELGRAREFVREFCRKSPSLLDEDRVGALELAVNEAASNIMKHAYRGRTDQSIDIDADAFQSRIAIRLHHLGDPFDPGVAPRPALDGSQESGFGIYLIMHSVDEVRYYRDERGKNCIALVKLSNTVAEDKGENNGNTGREGRQRDRRATDSGRA